MKERGYVGSPLGRRIGCRAIGPWRVYREFDFECKIFASDGHIK